MGILIAFENSLDYFKLFRNLNIFAICKICILYIKFRKEICFMENVS